MTALHVVDLPVCGGRVWCHTRLTHDEASEIADAHLQMIPDMEPGDLGKLVALRDRQSKGGKRPGIIELPSGMLPMARDAGRRQRQYDETLVRVMVDHWSNVKDRDGSEIPDKAKELLGRLDSEDWDALLAGAKAAREVGRPDPQSGSPLSSGGQSPTDAQDSRATLRAS